MRIHLARIPPFPQPLDLTSVPAHRALSLRQLTIAYAGPLVELRRSSDNAATNVQPAPSGYISGASSTFAGPDLATWAGSDNLFVRTLYDQSGNAGHFTQLTNAAQPQFFVDGGSGINNRPILRCVHASGQFMQGGSPILGPSDLTFSFVIGNITFTSWVFGTQLASGTHQLFDIVARLNSTLRNQYFNTPSGTPMNLGSGSAPMGVRMSQYLLVATNDPSSGFLGGMAYERGILTDTTVPTFVWGNSDFNNNYILFAAPDNTGGGVNFYGGDFAELVMFTSSLSASDQLIMNNSERIAYNLA